VRERDAVNLAQRRLCKARTDEVGFQYDPPMPQHPGGHWEREDEGVEPWVVEPLADVAAGGHHQPLFALGDCRERGESLLARPGRQTTVQDDQVPRHTTELLDEFEVVATLGEEER